MKHSISIGIILSFLFATSVYARGQQVMHPYQHPSVEKKVDVSVADCAKYEKDFKTQYIKRK